MALRHTLLVGMTMALAGPALTETGQAQTGQAQTGQGLTQSQVVPSPMPAIPPMRPQIPARPGAPRTLTEALAATYSNQPALQAERAKLDRKSVV